MCMNFKCMEYSFVKITIICLTSLQHQGHLGTGYICMYDEIAMGSKVLNGYVHRKFIVSSFDLLGDDTSISYGSFMRAEHLRVLIHIRTKGEVDTA